MGAEGATRGLARFLTARGWPLVVIIAIQAGLSMWLIWSTTAFQDEALYLAVGHLELSHLLHHTPITDFATFLSGAPVLYPPLGAIADSLGGLAAARLLSLAFMIVATILLHGVARRILSSRTAACFAAALFGWVAPAQFLGAFATYDAMALFLLALAVWLAVRAAGGDWPVLIILITLAGIALATADATKYAATLFDPVVILIAALAVSQVRGWLAGLAAGFAMAAMTTALLIAAYRLAGHSYAEGIAFTTLHRSDGTDSVRAVLSLSANAVGIIAVLGVFGSLAMTFRRQRSGPATTLAWTLAGAAFLAPAEQARIHTTVSAFKHVGYGAWFASVMAGYLLTLPARRTVRTRIGAARLNGLLTASTAVVLLTAVVGARVTGVQYHSWPNATRLVAALGKLARPGRNYLIEDSNVPAYYLRSSIGWSQINNTFYFGFVDPANGRYIANDPAYVAAVRERYFAAIVLNFGDTYTVDETIVHDIGRYRTYHLLAVVPYQTSAGSGEYKIFVPSARSAG